MTLRLLALLLLTVASALPEIGMAAESREAVLCGIHYAKKHRQDVIDFNRGDKWNHCTLSCVMTLKCGVGESYAVGLMKELKDLVGPGTPDLEDIQANVRGIGIAQDLKRKYARPHSSECYQACFRVFR